jgi:aldehyde dehydrogenase (NAD+)
MISAFKLQHPDRLFIGGRWIAPSTTRRFEILHPATQEFVAEVAEAREVDIDLAIEAARLAFDKGEWPSMPLGERCAVLARWANAIAAREAEIAIAHTAQIGIPISFSRAVASGAATSLRAAIETARAYLFREERSVAGGVAQIWREPVGVVAAIVPWNYPSLLGMYKMAPALLAGCTVVVKPSPEAPLDLLIIAECAEQAGMPEGVLSILTAGREMGQRLVSDPRIDKVSFTGSSAAGKHIGVKCMERVARVTLELGGKSAAILLQDYPLDAAVPVLVGQSTLFNGQACMGLTRVLVPRGQQEELLVRLAHAYAELKVGDPFDESVRIGPLASLAQRDRVAAYIDSGKDEGARLYYGGDVDGCFVQPTIFADVRNDMRIAQEEIFGPVLSVIPYDTLDEAIEISNASPFGLSGAVFTNDRELALSIARQIRSGSIAQNAMGPQNGMPFGGYKQSGFGREGSAEALNLYTEIKTIYLKHAAAVLDTVS